MSQIIKFMHWTNIAVMVIVLAVLVVAEVNPLSPSTAQWAAWIGMGVVGAIVLSQMVCVFLAGEEKEEEKQKAIVWFSWLAVASAVVLAFGAIAGPVQWVGASIAGLIFFLGVVVSLEFVFGVALLLASAEGENEKIEQKANAEPATSEAG